LFIAGVLFGENSLAWTGVFLFGAQTLFTLVTLPVEFDASARAQQLLVSQGIIYGEQQVEGIEKVLGAAAWTYVAGAVSAVGSFLYVAYIVYSMVRRNG
jgi:Zn-dependent membrane protease YugP